MLASLDHGSGTLVGILARTGWCVCACLCARMLASVGVGTGRDVIMGR